MIMCKAYYSRQASGYWSSGEDFSVQVTEDSAELFIWDPMYPDEPFRITFKGERKEKFLQDLEAMEADGRVALLDANAKPTEVKGHLPVEEDYVPSSRVWVEEAF